MKKLMLWVSIFVTVLLASSVFAALEPSIAWCLHNDYERDTEGNCVFDDGNKCSLQEFKDGTCGQEYVKEESKILCRGEGENLYWNTEQCCPGLKPVAKLGPFSCEKLNFLERFWYWLTSLF